MRTRAGRWKFPAREGLHESARESAPNSPHDRHARSYRPGVTGASGGLGRVIARRLHQEVQALVVSGRRATSWRTWPPSSSRAAPKVLPGRSRPGGRPPARGPGTRRRRVRRQRRATGERRPRRPGPRGHRPRRRHQRPGHPCADEVPGRTDAGTTLGPSSDRSPACCATLLGLQREASALRGFGHALHEESAGAESSVYGSISSRPLSDTGMWASTGLRAERPEVSPGPGRSRLCRGHARQRSRSPGAPGGPAPGRPHGRALPRGTPTGPQVVGRASEAVTAQRSKR